MFVTAFIRGFGVALGAGVACLLVLVVAAMCKLGLEWLIEKMRQTPSGQVAADLTQAVGKPESAATEQQRQVLASIFADKSAT